LVSNQAAVVQGEETVFSLDKSDRLNTHRISVSIPQVISKIGN
jgi:hypothetical protein